MSSDILDLDVGNTRLKWRLSGGDCVADAGAVSRADRALQALPPAAPARIRICSVAGEAFDRDIGAALLDRYGVPGEFAAVTRALCGVRCGYDDPAALGVDRWLAVVAAWQHYGRACIVVDVGSACTLDVVGPTGDHRGGYIVPGFRLTLDVQVIDPAIPSVDATWVLGLRTAFEF
ncbi:MAG: type III pantothenate kinase [Gammaproteobacteria bacterium]|nr:type III pantothenate kinase [Gammaproteobacteria bacterium]